jgi:tetratricopeptide (TPR) repeat protein
MSAEYSKSGFARARLAAAAGAFAVVLAAGSAFAAGGGGGGGGGGDAPPPGSKGQSKSDLTTCPPGQIWDKKKHACLHRRSGILPDAEMTEYAFSLASAERYQEALDVLDLLGNPNTPRALNYRGYATRKLGRVEEGIGYYLQSIALDPKYPQVREYLGEAYVIEGKYDLAKAQLSTIGQLCGKDDCEYYQRLSNALVEAHAL